MYKWCAVLLVLSACGKTDQQLALPRAPETSVAAVPDTGAEIATGSPDVAAATTIAKTPVAFNEPAMPAVEVPDAVEQEVPDAVEQEVPDAVEQEVPDAVEQEVADTVEDAGQDSSELANARVLWHLAKAVSTQGNLKWRHIEAWVDGDRGLVNGGPFGVHVVSGATLRRRPREIISDNLTVIGFSHDTLSPEDLVESCSAETCEWGGGHFASAVFVFGRRADGHLALVGTWEAPAPMDGDDTEGVAKSYRAWQASLRKIFGMKSPD